MQPNKVTAGDKLKAPSAQMNNDLVDLLNATKQHGRVRPQQPKHTPHNWVAVKVRNDTGADLPRGSVVEFTDFLLDDLEPGYFWLAGVEPDRTNHGWGILKNPVINGEIDECLCNGVCLALVDFTSDLHKFARREPGQSVLRSDDRGAVKILHDPGGGSERLCLVHILDDTPNWYLGITREAFTQGEDTYFELDVYIWNEATEKFSKVPGFVLQAADWFLNEGEEVEEKTKVRVDWYINQWVVTALYCSPTDLDDYDGSPPSPGEMEANLAAEPPDIKVIEEE